MKELIEKGKYTFKILLVVFLLLFLCSLLYKQYQEIKRQKSNIEILYGDLKTYHLKNGKLVTSNENLIFTNNQLKDYLKAKDLEVAEIMKKFSKVKTYTKIVDRFSLDTIKIIYKDSLNCKFKFKGNVFQKEYSFNYESSNKEFKILDLNISDTLSIVTGQKRKWIFGKTTNTIDVLHSNKYIQTSSLNHFEVKEKVIWYNSKLFTFSVGFILGRVSKK